MRQVAHETNRVGNGELATIGGLALTNRWVEGGKQRVFNQHTGLGDAVEQRRLTGVGVSSDSYRRHLGALAVGALGLASRLHLLDLLAQLGHAGVDATTIELDLGLTRTARTHTNTTGGLTTGLTRHGFTPTAKSRQ